MSKNKVKVTREQLVKQMQGLGRGLMETRHGFIEFAQKFEEYKLRNISEFQVVVKTLCEELGLDEEALLRRVGDQFKENVDKYNQMMQEQLEEFEKQAQAQAEQLQQTSEEDVEEDQEVELCDDCDEECEECESDTESKTEA